MEDGEEYHTFIFAELAEVRAENGILKTLVRTLLADAAQRSDDPHLYIHAISEQIRAGLDQSRIRSGLGLPPSPEAIALQEHIDWYLRSILDTASDASPVKGT